MRDRSSAKQGDDHVGNLDMPTLVPVVIVIQVVRGTEVALERHERNAQAFAYGANSLVRIVRIHVFAPGLPRVERER